METRRQMAYFQECVFYPSFCAYSSQNIEDSEFLLVVIIVYSKGQKCLHFEIEMTQKLFSVLYIYYCAVMEPYAYIEWMFPNQVKIPSAAFKLLEILEVEYVVA